ncbi:MAG: carbonic anhydrase [Methanobacteriota archaeon]
MKTQRRIQENIISGLKDNLYSTTKKFSHKKTMRELVGGWWRHHEKLGKKIEDISKGQDPKILSLCCSDSRVDLSVIFDKLDQGSIFQVRNVGGLFTEDAIPAFVYALNHLKPDVILVVHHTNCGGYSTLFKKRGVEPEIRYYMLENGGGLAKLRVEEYIKEEEGKPKKGDYQTLVIEEGGRIQVDRMLYFLKVYYPKVHKKITGGSILLLPLIYDLNTDEIYILPENLKSKEKKFLNR